MLLLDVFLEALLDISILPFGYQNSFSAILHFQPDKASVAIGVATVGAVVACVINWWIGRYIGNYLTSKHSSSQRFANIKLAFADYIWPILLLTWIPLGNFLPLVAGALGYKLRPALLLSGAAMVGFYIYQALSVV